MGNDVYLILECPEAGDELLIRKANEGYLSNTFGEALDYLLEENDSYSANQIGIIRQIKKIMDMSYNRNIALRVFDKEGTMEDPKMIGGIELETIISDYSSRVIQTSTKRLENGKKLKFDYIEINLAGTWYCH